MSQPRRCGCDNQNLEEVWIGCEAGRRQDSDEVIRTSLRGSESHHRHRGRARVSADGYVCAAAKADGGVGEPLQSERLIWDSSAQTGQPLNPPRKMATGNRLRNILSLAERLPTLYASLSPASSVERSH